MNKISAVVIVLGLAVFSPAANAQPVLAAVPETLIGQQTNVWCWAASGEMAMQYFNFSVQQCAEATLQFGQAAGVNCCNSPTPGACISGGQVYINHYNFTYQQLGGADALTHNQIVEQIVMRHEPWIFNPYCADSSKCGTWGHVVTGRGYYWPFRQVFPNLFYVWANDPWPVNAGSSYFQSYNDYKKGCWWGLGSCDGVAEGWDIYNIVPPKMNIPKIYEVAELPHLPWPPEEARLLLEGDPDPAKVAQAALRLMSMAATKETTQALGFESPAAANARLHPGIEQFDISLERLRSWNRERPAMDLLERTPSLMVPVEAGGRLRSSIRLRQEGKIWRLSAFGNPQLTAAWERARGAGAEFLVFVQGLEVVFAAKRGPNALVLISLFNDPAFQLKEGEQQPARQVLGRLADHAANYRGNGATLRRPGATAR